VVVATFVAGFGLCFVDGWEIALITWELRRVGRV
jgi:hypothetical protein